MAMRKLSTASMCWEHAHLLRTANVWAEEACGWHYLSQVHAVTPPALRRTTLSDLQRVVRGDSVQHVKRPSGNVRNVAHKRCKVEEPPVLEASTHLRDIQIPLEDMGDVIVLTGL